MRTEVYFSAVKMEVADYSKALLPAYLPKFAVLTVTGSLFYLENGGSRFLQNIGTYLPT
jgi:hypothetical protein